MPQHQGRSTSLFNNKIEVKGVVFESGENESQIFYETRVGKTIFIVLQPKRAVKPYWAVIVMGSRGRMRPLNTAIINSDGSIKEADPLYVHGTVEPNRDYWLTKVAEYIQSGTNPFGSHQKSNS